MVSLSKIKMLLSILLCSTMMLKAQSETNLEVISDTTKTLLANVKISKIWLYIAPEAQYSQLAGEFTTFHGVSIMTIVNQKFAIGATFASNQRSFTPKEINANEALGLRYRSSGLRLEYSFSPHILIHLSIPITLGFGHASVDSINAVLRDYDHDRDGRSGRREFRNGSSFGYIQPALNLDVNVFKYGKCFIGAGYRTSAYTQFLCGIDFAFGPLQEIIITTESVGSAKEFISVIRNNYSPNKIFLLLDKKEKVLASVSPYLKNYKIIKNKTEVYICLNLTCLEPVFTTAELKQIYE